MPRRAWAVTICLVAAACGSLQPVISPADRLAVIETTGCGLAAGRSGTGIALDGNTIVTVAHLIVQSDAIEARVGGQAYSAIPVGLDLERDLAVLRFDGPDMTRVAMGDAGAGSEGAIATSAGRVPFIVDEPVSISIEEVLGTERHHRIGYRVEADTGVGDSGSGAYDADGELIGVVFAVSGPTTWLTSSFELEQFLAAVPEDAPELECDPEISRRPSS